MKQWISLLLVLALTAGIMMGCGKAKNGRELMAEAYAADHDCKAKDIKVQYYGEFEGCHVGMVFGPDVYYSQAVLEEQVGDTVFRYPQQHSLSVCRDGKLLELKEAYEAGWLSQEAVDQIYAAWTQTTQTTQTTQSTATTNGATVVYSYLSDLPEDVQQSIFEAAVDTYQCNERIWEALAPQAHLFGVFDDTYVFLDLYEGSEDMEYMDTVNDLAFRYASSNKLCVYRAGQFYSLPDAYEAGVLSDAHLQQVYEQYYAIYPNMR